jgi:hypothetical protein
MDVCFPQSEKDNDYQVSVSANDPIYASNNSRLPTMQYNAPIFIKMHCDTQVVFIWFFSAGFIFQFSTLYISAQRPFTGGKGPGGLWKSYLHTAVRTQREHQTRIRKS